MPTKKDISEISLSKPTLSDEDALLYLESLENLTLGFTEYNKDNCEDITRLANAFINNHSYIDYNIATYYSVTPLHIFRFDRDGQLIEGLIYSNGAVALFHAADKNIHTIDVKVWVSPTVIKNFNYPLPKKEE